MATKPDNPALAKRHQLTTINHKFIKSVKKGRLHKIIELFAGSKCSLVPMINHRVENYWTALHIACYSGDLLVMEFLLSKGAAIDARTKS